MRLYTVTVVLLMALAGDHCYAQGNKEFSVYLRTKDSLMHIAFYDKDVSGYAKNLNKVLAKFEKLSATDQEAFRDYIEEEYYYLARAYAQSGQMDSAMVNLVLSKYSNSKQLQNEPDFEVLRYDPRFIKFLNSAKGHKSKYLATLQQDARYNTTEMPVIPGVTYQSSGDPKLMLEKAEFNLDSVAGSGNEVSQIINLMEWVHYLIPHDGVKGNPEKKNALSLIAECRKDKKTLNSRGLAIVLNEIYLAQGFKSRYVACLPKDPADDDSHAINMVWSKSLKKWLWMDPTFMAYVMNEDGELLSIEEVRERLVNNKPLILNPDANRNHAATQTKSDYLENYMAKNLYSLECPVSSEYNYETREEHKPRSYIQLIPGDAVPSPVIERDKNGAESYSLYYTNNPKAFWMPPLGANDIIKPGRVHRQSEYEVAISRLKQCYNAKDLECMNELVVPQAANWDEKKIGSLVKKFGMMISYKFLGMEVENKYEDVALFKVVFDNSVHCMAISLDDKNRLAVFKFKTTSNYIDWLLAKAIDSETPGIKKR